MSVDDNTPDFVAHRRAENEERRRDDIEHQIKKLRYKLSRDADAVFGAEHREERESVEDVSHSVSGAIVGWSMDVHQLTFGYEDEKKKLFLKLVREYVRIEYMGLHGRRYPKHLHKRHCAEIYYLLKGTGALGEAYAKVQRLVGEPMYHKYEAVIAQLLSDAFVLPHMLYWEGHEGDNTPGETHMP